MGTAVLHRVVPGGALSTSSRSACTVALLQKAVQTDTAHLGSAQGPLRAHSSKQMGIITVLRHPVRQGPACLLALDF